MADATGQPDGADPFADILGGSSPQQSTAAPSPQPTGAGAPQGQDPFADLLAPSEEERAPSGLQTSAQSFERGIVPAAGGLAGMGLGAAAGAAVGAPFGGVGAIPGAVIGGAIGGIVGGFGGSFAAEQAQNFAAQALPENWKDVLGGTEEQQELGAKYHPTESFLGGVAPYVLTMKPSISGLTKALGPNATALSRVSAALPHVFGGAVMGGMELGQEVAAGQPPDWRNIAISTGLGVVFNEPNRIGSRLIGSGEALIPERFRPPANENAAAPPTAEPVPTVAQAGDTKVMGPGITEDVFMGAHQQAPQAEMASQDAARTEQSVLAPESLPRPGVAAVARRTEPELFGQYDALARQEADIRARIDQINNPPDDMPPVAPEQAQSELAALSDQLAKTRESMWGIVPQVAAAHRRAGEVAGAGFVEPEELPPSQQLAPAAEPTAQPAQGSEAAPSPGGPVTSAEQEQAAAIAANVVQQVTAAGRPEEADALGQLLASHYLTRSRRFKGALGSPLELYNAEGPRIRGTSRPEAPVPAAEAAPAITFEEASAAADQTGTRKLVEQLINRGASDREIADTTSRKLSENQVAAFRAGMPERKPPLMPTEAAPDIGRPAEVKALQAAPAEATQEQAPRNASEVESLDPASIGVDANRFQFKANTDEEGVSERLQGVQKWDARLAGTALVYRDADGKDWIADGHQRLGLAKRLAASGQPDIKLNAFVLDAKDGITDADARAIAAAKNIAEGTGTPIDAAKVIKDAKDRNIDLPPLPPRSALVRDGEAIAKLSPDAFGMAVNEVVPSNQAAIVGRLVTDPEAQTEAMRLLAQMKPDNARQAEMIVRDMMSSGTDRATQQSLFGDEAFTNSIVRERAKIADDALKQLKRDKQTFRTLVDEADRIEGQGNVLERGANEGRLTSDEKAAQFLTQLAFRAGPVSDALSGVARQLRDGTIKPADAARSFLGAVRDAIEGGVVEGADTGVPVAGAAGERQDLAASPQPIDFDTYAAQRGASSLGIGDAGLHRSSEHVSQAAHDRNIKRQSQRDADLIERRHLLRQEYDAAVSRGEIREPTSTDRLIATANGHVDNAATQAARRLLDKRGIAWQKPLATEPGAEGLPQTLIPGVAPVTDAERMAREAARPLAGDTGELPGAGSLFDTDAGKQQTLFQEAPPVSTPAFERWFKDSKVVDEHGAPLVVYRSNAVRSVLTGEPAVPESSVDGLRGNAELAANLLEGKTFREHGLSGFDAPTQRVVLRSVLSFGDDPKVLDAVVKFVPVDVVDMLAARDLGPEAIFRDEAVLRDVLSINHNNSVPGGIDVADLVGMARSLGERVTSMAAEGTLPARFVSVGVPRGAGESGSAPATDVGYLAVSAHDPNLLDFKSNAIGANRGTFDPTDPRILFQPAYHGTPHIFDRFSSDKIGTGEGAQAYGHGLYFAGKKAVAEWYRNNLAGPPKGQVLLDGEKMTNAKLADTDAPTGFLSSAEVQTAFRNRDEPRFRAAVETRIGDLRQQAKGYEDRAAEQESPNSKVIAATLSPSDLRERASMRTKEADRLEAFAKRITFDVKQPGRLYHVDVPEDHELLDWDKPLSEQPEGVREKLATLGFKSEPPAPIESPTLRHIVRDAIKAADGDASQVAMTIDNDSALYNRARVFAKMQGTDPDKLDGIGDYIEHRAAHYLDAVLAQQRVTGEKIYEKIGLASTGKNERGQANLATKEDRAVLASKALADAGIPGHKYVGHESNSTNYVIYDDSRVNIRDFEQQKRGSISLKPGTRPIIKLFKDADASTLIHETGHQWLEEMLRDAAHPAATDQIKADMGTVRNWLGMKDDQSAPARDQHEKFATGFEQYMREGIAPSPGLARVFAHFKNWLTSIYKTLTGLGEPISDDIRGVFDRLIAEEPQRTVLGESSESGQGMAGLHENDAATVAPHEAEPAMDRIGAESVAYIEDLPPEVRNELATAESRVATADAANAGREDATGAAEPQQVVEGSGGPNAEPAGGSGGSQPGPVIGSSVEAGPEGAGVAQRAGGAGAAEPGLRSERSEPAGAAGAATATGNPLAPTAAERFGPRDSQLIDKAGNIRIDNLNTTADVANAIRLSATENNDFIGDRRGVITDGQVLDLADALGMTPEMLNRRRLGEAFNAEQVVAARKLLIQSATDLSDMAKRAAGGTDEEVMAYAQAKARHNLIQAHVSGITAEAGRALRAFRRLPGQAQAQSVDDILRQSQAKTLFQLKAEAALMSALDSPEEVSKFARDSRQPDFWDGLLEYWTNALISNPATHATYAIGNEIMSLLKAGPETGVAAAIGKLRQLTGREGERVHFAEVAAQFGAHAEAIPGALKAFGQSAQRGTTTLLPGEKPRNLPFQAPGVTADYATYDPAYQARDILPDLYGSVRGVLDGTMVSGYMGRLAQGVDGAPTISFQPSRTGIIPNVAYRGVTVLPTGEAARLPGRMVASIHSFFRATNYSMELSRLATRQAIEEGLAGTKLDARIAQLRQNPGEDMMKAARGVATELTLMGQGGKFAQALSHLTNQRLLGIPMLKFIDPFVKISGNIMGQSLLQRTPVGILSGEIRADLAGKNGNVAQDTAMARMLVGTALSIGVGALAAKGLITGSGPADPNKAALWRMAGYQPHSVRIGDTWYSVGHLGPLGMLMGVAADMYDVAHQASDGQMLEAGSALQHAFTQNILDESFARGPSDLIKAVEDPGRYGQSYIRNQISSFLPYSSAMRQMAIMSDPYSRQARSIMDGIKAKVPGMSESLAPWRDIFGNPEPNLPGLGGLTSIYMSQMQKDPVYQAMLNLGINTGQPTRDIRGVRLTDQQYDQYQQLAGRMAKQRLDQIITSAQWRSWSPEIQHDIVTETFTQSRETARGMMLARFPQIAAQAVRNKLAQLGR